MESATLVTVVIMCLVWSASSGLKAAALRYGQTYVVQPKGEHLATMVWLHGLTDDGFRASMGLQALPIKNVKFICPTAPTRPVIAFHGAPTTAWFDVDAIPSPNTCPKDIQGLDDTAELVAKLLAAEPPHVKKGIGGFSLGSATTYYTVTSSVIGKLSNGKPYRQKFDVALALSGWLPCAQDLLAEVQSSPSRASRQNILLCHGEADDIVPFEAGRESASMMKEAGFDTLIFNSYPMLPHFFSGEEMNEVVSFLKEKGFGG